MGLMRAKYSPGEISTYLSVDTERLATAINYIHCTWDYPLRIVVVLCALYRLLGYSALAGVAVLVASTQLSALLVQVVDRKFKQLVDYRDQRLRMVGETIGNIKQVKMYSWQDAFADRIDRLWKGVMSLASSLVSFFIGFVTFAAYESLNGEPRRPLTSQLVFVSLSLFAILQEPIAEIPTAVSMLLNAARSLVRLCDFAMCDEVVPDIRQCQNSNRGDATDMMIQIVDGAFRWSVNDSASVLSGVNVECQRGELVSVIGKVGSGKSSLISAILGDMVRTTGEVHIYGTVAYVPQQPWIFNATLRDNILFGRHFDKELYDQVIDACALGPDLSMFAAGDLTEIGEKGVNLSGGQKARVSLARAVYSRADIYILDDPLSAVDVHVGRHIFKHVLGPQGMLNSYACILTTNNVDYVLAGSDRIVSIDGGRVRYQDLARHARGSVNAARNIGISAIDEALNGSATIRAYKRRDSFEGAFSACTENYARAWWTFLCPNRWLATRLDLVSAAIACTAALLLVTMQCLFNSISSSYAGLSLTYALAIVGVLNTCLRSTMMIELSFISVERIRQYSLVTPEAESAVDGCRPAEMWPEHGSLEFAGYSARYRRDADLVLKDLSFRVEPRHKVGIVGRTGAGKSSLTLALFRIIEAASGKILIDGMDIAQYGLCDVRSRLSIIPQDPLMFAATVRQNLDPLGDYSDQQIWSALERVHLAESVRSKGEGLEYGVAQGGANFSVGQRQLFCIARALLKRARILVLDEATAAIDSSTDAMIQETIRREFRECTVLTIAHRLDTIIDSDMVLVIDSGSVAEYDTPDNLLAHKASVFSLLVAEARAGATAEQSSPQRHQK
ncbi:hypothetical protein LPJ53_000837 [Coemansia erecta]|uniref:P-loop containing nucleoside triphosphate hydrolase protein n=1 Tax=Coemansia erecta TaxID=147472 RepID=A0A9W7Y6L9_9FUNG|nr:hypothetical protein LPJ53_000837 [Coemansia erecta]